MFLKVNGNFVETRILHEPDKDLRTETVKFFDTTVPAIGASPLMDTLNRICKGERCWFYDGQMDSNLSILRQYIQHGQVGRVDLLESTYRASQREIIDAVGLENMDHSPSQQMQVNLEWWGMGQGGYMLPSWGATHYGLALAWLCQTTEVASFAWARAMEYSYEQARAMDPTIDGWDTSTTTLAWCKTQHVVGTLIAHVNLACQVALDTPQPITLNITPDYAMTFTNVRVGPNLRGLLITLPTGGVIFYRDAQLLEGGRFSYLDGQDTKQRTSRKTVVKKLMEQTTIDLQWQHFHSRIFRTPMTPVMAAWDRFVNAAES